MIALDDRAVEAGALATELGQLGGRLMMLFATGSPEGEQELCALVRAGDRVTKLRAPVQARAYPAVTPMVPAAHWFERELHDLHEIIPEGHPRLEPLVRHPPEPREVELPEEEDVRLTHRGAERLAGPGVFVIPYGPVRSGVFESAQFLVQTGGEDVAYCAQRLFFKRRGAERRICEVPPDLAVLVDERVSGTSSVAHALAFAHAVESLAETEVPPRAQAIRRILAELERLYNHLEVTVRECEDASLSVGQAQFAALKERLHRLCGALVGNRYLRGAVIPGGTRIDLDTTAVELMTTTMTDWERDWTRTLAVLLRTDSFLDRLVSAGPLSEEDARDFACVGPVARASNIDLDTRRDLGYDGYPAFEVARHSDGDAMARMEVRFQEVLGSLELIREAAASITPGPTRAERGPFIRQSALGAAES
ncbi:MAG TPA: NADH-quinone oxidoreductase subunit C, partial [Solirubrobacteraceae bacterium]|nr:NADH-quinone oxidoreductase subunit C [Solirubrobacteraceae bacterium]